MHHCTIAIFAKYMQVFIDNVVLWRDGTRE